MLLHVFVLLALARLGTPNTVKRAFTPGANIGSKLTEGPGQAKKKFTPGIKIDDKWKKVTEAQPDVKRRSVLLSLALKDTESPKGSMDGSVELEDYFDNPNSALNTMLALARRAAKAKECVIDDGSSYRGVLSTTSGGYTCQKWTSQTPHGHSRTPAKYPNHGLGDHNYCRNPDGEHSLWCYTTSAKKRWDYCKLSECEIEDEKDENDWCKYEKSYLSGYSYGTYVFKTLTLAKAACLKSSSCGGISKESSTRYTLRRGSSPRSSSRGTSWIYCEDNDFKATFEAKIASLKSSLETKLKSVDGQKAMTAFVETSSNTISLLQWYLLSKIKAGGHILNYSEDETIKWILNDVDALQTLTMSGEAMDSKWKEAVQNLAKLIKSDKEAKSGMKLKLAVGCALTFATPVAAYANGSRTIDMVERYNSFVKWNDDGVLFDAFKTLNAWQYRYVVGSWSEDSELEWARNNVKEEYKTPLKIGEATHAMIAYTLYNKFGVSVQNFWNYYADQVQKNNKTVMVYREVTMELVDEVGAVCGGISKFGVAMTQAFGLPAMPVGQPGHCAFLWYRNGVFKISNDISGWGGSSVHGGIAWTWNKGAAWYPLMNAAQKNSEFWQTEKMRIATEFKSDMGIKFEILEKCTEMCPQNYLVWLDLIETLKDKTLIKDASDSLLDTITWVRKSLTTVSNLAPENPVKTSFAQAYANNIVDLSGSTTWTSTEKTAWFEVDLQGICIISSLEIQWWGQSISSDYDILIQGPDNRKWTKVLGEEDETGAKANFNGWSYHSKGWVNETSKVRFELRDGVMDYWGYKSYFGVRQLKINGIKMDNNTVIAQSKEVGNGGEIDLVDICALNSLEVKGSGKVTVSASTDGVKFSQIASAVIKESGELDIPLSGVATNLKIAVNGGKLSEAAVVGIRYTVKDILKIQVKKDLQDNEVVEADIRRKINSAK